MVKYEICIGMLVDLMGKEFPPYQCSIRIPSYIQELGLFGGQLCFGANHTTNGLRRQYDVNVVQQLGTCDS